MLPPNIVYISGKTQYDALENPNSPLNSEARDEVVDAAWYRDMIEILMPPIEPKKGPLEPWVAETIYPVIDEEEEGAPRRSKFLGIFATLEEFVEAFTADPPEIQNTIDCFIVHSDYLVELIDEVTVKAGRDTIYGYLRDIMETTPLFVVQASVNAEQFSMYQDAMNELSDYLINAQVDLGVYPYPIEWTTYDKENPEAEWDFYPGHVIANNFYKAILEYIDRAPEKNDAFLAFQGLLVYRTDTELASIQGEVSPDEQHINGSPYIGRCVTITSKKGGTGKTTTSLGLANALAKYSQKAVEEGRAKTPLKIIVIDLDLQDGQVGYDTGNQTKTVVGIFDDFRSEYRVLGEDPEEDWRIINDNINHNTRVGVDTLLAPENPTDLNDLRPPFYRTIIQAIREHYDIVIIDTSVLLNDPYMKECAYPLTHKLYYVTQPHFKPLITMKRQFVYGLGSGRHGGGMEPRRISVFVNGVEDEDTVKAGSAVSLPGVQDYCAAGIEVLTGVPYLHRKVLDATNPRLPGGFDYLLENDGYREGMEVLLYDIIRGTDYPLFDAETAEAFEADYL